MDIKISKEDLSQHDTGGGYRESLTNIVVDSTDSLRHQRRTIIYETLGAILDPFETNAEYIECLTDAIVDALDQLGG